MEGQGWNRHAAESSAEGTTNDETACDRASPTVGVVVAICLFILAGLLEIGGGYLMWLGIREKKRPSLFIPLGAVTLVLYGVVASFQTLSSFARVVAVYGGFFIVMSYAWATAVDGFRPDTGDFIGASISLGGVLLAWFWPR